uniref:Uncharacterized protein n=1 Tax=Anguilla anguilla TaxID=7936 RepID=A0A0E9V215_ANGAN
MHIIVYTTPYTRLEKGKG